MNSVDAASATELRIERLIAAPPERVFALWTEPELMAQWLAPFELTVASCDADLKPGRPWRVTMQHPDGKQITVSGMYREIEPPRRLVFSWAWLDLQDARHETEITVTLTGVPGGTKLVLHQRGFESGTSRDQHNHGWGGCFDKLERIVAAA